VHRRADKKKFMARTLTLKIKYADFTVITRSRTVGHYIRTYSELFDLGKELLLQADDLLDRKIRLMGLTLRNADAEQGILPPEGIQLSLEFED
jgi:DNA polymerase-4